MATDTVSTDKVMVGFVGAGKMAQAICRGLLSSGLLRANQITLSDPHQNQIPLLKPLGVTTTTSNQSVVNTSNLIILAVKPLVIKPVLKEIANSVTKDHIIVSVAAGVFIKDIEEELPPGSRVIRVLPNTPSLVREGVSGISLGTHATQEDGGLVKTLLKSLGIAEMVDEKYLDAISGLSGSGPAYMFVAMEAMADGGVKMGLSRQMAIKFAAQTMLGAAKMVLETGKHPAQLKDEVCSPGGSTIAALHQLERCGLRNALLTAVETSAIKSGLLGQSKDSSSKLAPPRQETEDSERISLSSQK